VTVEGRQRKEGREGKKKRGVERKGSGKGRKGKGRTERGKEEIGDKCYFQLFRLCRIHTDTPLIPTSSVFPA